jgi:hypothetical protein
MLNPIPSQSVNRPSEVERRVLCSRYSECLEICLSKGWPGFSCSQCHDFELECPNDTAHWAEQSQNAGCLLMSAGFFPKWVIEKVGNRNRPEGSSRDFV